MHVYFYSIKPITDVYIFLRDTNNASHTSAVQVELSGSCSVVAAGSGSVAAKTVAAVVGDEHSWSPSVAHFSHLSDQVEYTDDTSISSPLALVLYISCSDAYHLGSLDGFAVYTWKRLKEL